MGRERWEDVAFIIVDDEGIRRLNARFMMRDEPTDVLCFSYTPLPGVTDPRSAEIYINAQRARLVGRRFGGVARELALYIAHACNHLTGADDASPAQRRRMRRRERLWLNTARADGLLKGILAP